MQKPNITIQSLMGINGVPPYKTKLTPSSGGNSSQLVGMEIEVENVNRNHNEYQAMLSRGWVIKEDASLRGEAYEFITLPMRIDNLLPELTEFYRLTKFTENNFTDRCSIHIHANVLDFNQEQLAALALTYQTVEAIIFEFVGADRDTNLYCIPWSQCRMNHNLIDGLFNNTISQLKKWQKYTSLNLLPILRQGTVEFRHMHGSADMQKITTWVHMVGNLMAYSSKQTLDSMIDLIKGLNTTSQYNQFFEQVFQGVLPYNERYREVLEEGIINAKYSLVNWNGNTSKASKDTSALMSNWMEELIDIQNVHIRDVNNNIALPPTPADTLGLGPLLNAHVGQITREQAEVHNNQFHIRNNSAIQGNPTAGIRTEEQEQQEREWAYVTSPPDVDRVSLRTNRPIPRPRTAIIR